jgi:hypothetical protein
MKNKLQKFLTFTFNGKPFVALVLIFITGVSLFRASFLPEVDILWGARNGGDLLRNGATVFTPDAWNAITLGEEWAPNSWLWNVILYASFTAFGTAGFFVLTAATNFLIYLCFWLTLRASRLTPTWQFVGLFLIWAVTVQFLNGRSNTVDFLILGVFLLGTGKLRTVKKLPLKTGLYALLSFGATALWMNLHLTALAAIAVFPAVVYIHHYNYVFKKKLLFAAASFMGVLLAIPLTPFEVTGLVKVSQVTNESKDFFIEWSNVFATGTPNWAVIAVVVFGAVLALVALQQKQWIIAAILVVFCYVTFDTIRFTPFLLIFILASLRMAHRWKLPYRRYVQTVAILVVVAMLGVGAYSTAKVSTDWNSILPVDPINFSDVPSNAVVATDQDSGGTLLLYRPDVQVTLDGRNDLMGKERFVESSNILFSDDLDDIKDWLEEYDVDTVFVEDPEAYSPIVKNMNELDWIEKDGDGYVTFIQP